MAGHPREAEFIELDEGNEAELAEHHIQGAEVMQLLNSGPVWVPNKRGRAGLWLAVGFTDGGRALTVPVAYDDIRRTVRPITGWDSTTGEHGRYL